MKKTLFILSMAATISGCVGTRPVMTIHTTGRLELVKGADNFGFDSYREIRDTQTVQIYQRDMKRSRWSTVGNDSALILDYPGKQIIYLIPR